MRRAVRRLAAWLIDWLCISAWIGVTAAVGVPLYLAGVLRPGGVLALDVVGAVVVVLPVVLATAVLESRRGGATPGKRILRLEVRGPSGRLTFSEALLRNVGKLGVPLLLGHAAVSAIVLTTDATASVPVRVGVITGAAYVLPLLYLASLLTPSGRTPYDRLARAEVVPVQ